MTERKIEAIIARQKVIEAAFAKRERVIAVDIYRATIEGGAPYSGPYNVVPDFNGTTLETKNKSLSDDISVEPIYVSRTTNPSGGTTVYIGG